MEGFPDLRNRAGDHNILKCSFGCGISGHLPIYKEWADSALLAGIHVVAASGSPGDVGMTGLPLKRLGRRLRTLERYGPSICAWANG